MSTHIYCMPGMAASPKIFEYLKLPKNFEIHLLSWIPPLKDESLTNYAKRMCKRVVHKNPILLGVSFGGILVQEMAKHIFVKKIIIISSIKAKEELPLPMIVAKRTNVHKLLPTKLIENIEYLTIFAFGKGIKKRVALYQKYLSERNSEYLNWAINALVNWDQNKFSDKLIHIHGDSDTVFPVKNLINPYFKIKGGHAVIITESIWFNRELPAMLQK